MDKQYTSVVTLREARPRSKRFRELGGSASSSSSSTVVVQSSSGGSSSSGDGHTHANKEDLDQLRVSDENYIQLLQTETDDEGNSSKVLNGANVAYADEAEHAAEADNADKWDGEEFADYLDQAVRQADTVQFAKVLAAIFRTPGFVSGIETGAGASIEEDGSAEMDSLTLRSFLKVPKLIYNKVQVTGGEMWNTEGGTIASVEQDPDSDTAYILTMDVEDGDTIDLEVDDICKGHYNSGGTIITSYFRVTAVTQTSKTMRIVLGADSEVPGGENHAPVAHMIIARYGNFTDTERQSSQYFSSSEMRIAMLSGVDTYIVSSSNYKTVWGTMPDGLVSDDIPTSSQAYLYVNGILAQNFIQLDSSASVVKTIIDRGLWVEGTTDYQCNELYQDEVYHESCKYRCIVEGTLEEPAYDSTDWLLVAGDTTLSMEIDSSEGETFLYGSLSTVLTAVVRRGVNDITEDILDSDFSWTRDTGDETEDETWNLAHASCGGSVELTSEDLPDCSSGKFICTAYVRDGAESVTASVSF